MLIKFLHVVKSQTKHLAKTLAVILVLILGLFWINPNITKEHRTDYHAAKLAVKVSSTYKTDVQQNYNIIRTAKLAAADKGLPLDIVLGIIAVESSFDPLAVNKEKAFGVMQLTVTSGLLPLEPLDYEQNIIAGTTLLQQYKLRYSSSSKASNTRYIEAYNAGNRRNPAYAKRVLLAAKQFRM